MLTFALWLCACSRRQALLSPHEVDAGKFVRAARHSAAPIVIARAELSLDNTS